ncbi:MAG: metallophosphoesterase family protein [Humidesulfovibrio sp.]|nr:metallophosphoesterase family protein [Humidesulfovibrio sp.]
MYWIVVGDVHECTAMFEHIPDVIGAEALILSGDLTNRGGPENADRVLEAALCANAHVLAQVGNMDKPEVTTHLALKGCNIHRETRRLAPGLALMGVGYSTRTPFDTPSEADEEELALWLADTHAKAKALSGPGGRILAVIHNAPYGTNLDHLTNGMNVGSKAVRAFLDKAQPEICVCGHIHEGLGETRLGRCHVLNPGLLNDGGFVRVDMENGALTAVLGHI